MPRIRGADQGVQVEGLAELNRALRDLGGRALQKELKETNLEVAKFVAEDARSDAYALGGVAAKVAPSVKASAGYGFAGVSFGGSAYPMAMGAAFGGQKRPTTQQFMPHLGRTGYFPYPAIRRDGEKIEEAYGDGLDDLLKRVGLK